MRNIKFRGLKRNPYGDKWVYGYYALKDGKHIIIMPHSSSYERSLKARKPLPTISVEHEIDFKTVGQYTGLKDRKQVEIYEGDIIQYEDITKGIVRYSERYAQYVLVNTGSVKDEFETLGDYNIEVFEIIGNIYDNPELLEKASD